LIDPVSKRITRQGRCYRALRPLEAEEARVFAALLGGEFLVQGFRNKDVRRKLFAAAGADPPARKRASGRVTRVLRLLRAHRLIRKVSGTFYYRVTLRGQRLMTTALKLRELDIAMLAA
jgi:hypothetical protein